MLFLKLLPVILSFLLLAAHLLRHFNIVVAVLGLSPLVVLLIPRRIAALTVQVLLILAALEWVRTAADLVAARQAQGQDWLRAALILGGVTLFTLLSILVFHTKQARRYYAAPPIGPRTNHASSKLDG
jgi:hypothetical protein